MDLKIYAQTRLHSFAYATVYPTPRGWNVETPAGDAVASRHTSAMAAAEAAEWLMKEHGRERLAPLVRRLRRPTTLQYVLPNGVKIEIDAADLLSRPLLVYRRPATWRGVSEEAKKAATEPWLVFDENGRIIRRDDSVVQWDDDTQLAAAKTHQAEVADAQKLSVQDALEQIEADFGPGLANEKRTRLKKGLRVCVVGEDSPRGYTLGPVARAGFDVKVQVTLRGESGVHWLLLSDIDTITPESAK